MDRFVIRHKKSNDQCAGRQEEGTATETAEASSGEFFSTITSSCDRSAAKKPKLDENSDKKLTAFISK